MPIYGILSRDVGLSTSCLHRPAPGPNSRAGSLLLPVDLFRLDGMEHDLGRGRVRRRDSAVTLRPVVRECVRKDVLRVVERRRDHWCSPDGVGASFRIAVSKVLRGVRCTLILSLDLVPAYTSA